MEFNPVSTASILTGHFSSKHNRPMATENNPLSSAPRADGDGRVHDAY
jgi:hypothetical protein